MTNTPIQSDEELMKTLMPLLGFKWDIDRAWWFNEGNVCIYDKQAIKLCNRIKAYSQQQAILARIDELDALRWSDKVETRKVAHHEGGIRWGNVKERISQLTSHKEKL